MRKHYSLKMTQVAKSSFAVCAILFITGFLYSERILAQTETKDNLIYPLGDVVPFTPTALIQVPLYRIIHTNRVHSKTSPHMPLTNFVYNKSS